MCRRARALESTNKFFIDGDKYMEIFGKFHPINRILIWFCYLLVILLILNRNDLSLYLLCFLLLFCSYVLSIFYYKLFWILTSKFSFAEFSKIIGKCFCIKTLVALKYEINNLNARKHSHIGHFYKIKGRK